MLRITNSESVQRDPLWHCMQARELSIGIGRELRRECDDSERDRRGRPDERENVISAGGNSESRSVSPAPEQ